MSAILQETSKRADWVLGIDIGGSGSRAALEPVSGGAGGAGGAGAAVGTRHLFEAEPVSISPNGSSALPVIASLIERVRAERPDAALAGVGIGATGLASLVVSPAASLASLSASAGAPVALAIDAVTAHLGALGGSAGAVVAVGTGSIAIGTDFRDVWRRVGGWGHLYDDRGSGAWIGIEGLKAAIQTHDGVTTDAPALLSAAVSRFGPAPTWPSQLYTRDDRGAVLAGFAADVAGLASVGDDVATRIMATAGALVAGTLAAALDPALPARAAGVGGVFASGAAFTAAFAEAFARIAPDATLVEPAGGPLDGAVELARLVAADEVVAAHPPFIWR
ncbi:BadF/BadG/BcrA/BcrD ATPase family protein [Agromyces humatus]|uniref:BadF/BadG/BcrA/BcrD ATPase family protein n=1 Tax=Agromyces humatus TaxID=279573 RepID=A0ABP4WP01_9MICO|nr:BadF/BadG/BcrA/BcrD ATPase family protein [Agromyces humatus]